MDVQYSVISDRLSLGFHTDVTVFKKMLCGTGEIHSAFAKTESSNSY